MAIERFSLESLKTLDGGRVREAFEQALKRCMGDCLDRPGVDKERKVIMTATIVPVQADDGSMATCDVQIELDDRLPKRRSPAYNMMVDQGRLLFNELSPDDIHQGTLDENAPEFRKVQGGD